MNPVGCIGYFPRSDYKSPSEKQREVWALEREVECAEFMLNKVQERLAKARCELAIEKK